MARSTMRLLAVLLVVGVLVQAPQRASAQRGYRAGPAAGNGYPGPSRGSNGHPAPSSGGNGYPTGGSSNGYPSGGSDNAGDNNGGDKGVIVGGKPPRGPVCYDNNGFFKCKTRGPPFAIFPTSWCDCISTSGRGPLSWPHSCEVYAIAGNMRPIPC